VSGARGGIAEGQFASSTTANPPFRGQPVECPLAASESFVCSWYSSTRLQKFGLECAAANCDKVPSWFSVKFAIAFLNIIEVGDRISLLLFTGVRVAASLDAMEC